MSNILVPTKYQPGDNPTTFPDDLWLCDFGHSYRVPSKEGGNCDLPLET